MSFIDIVTTDILKYASPNEYEAFPCVYVHELDRILSARFTVVGCPASLCCIQLGYKKNEKFFLELEIYNNEIKFLKDNCDEKIETDIFSNIF
ncbi:hypothetical protein [Fluviispira multicolorata]|uniref:Uncharacterized protein n=1 Tax=Fluviispira multicolorata TaxID=2654512 RepID=A0A833JFC3_9BACT|nr:hypothetical protein [Fluviispira multicolorata]KAB8033646.1 hypothetical protein GCL57_02760 [Fluviispira multicolorata]